MLSEGRVDGCGCSVGVFERSDYRDEMNAWAERVGEVHVGCEWKGRFPSVVISSHGHLFISSCLGLAALKGFGYDAA